MGQHKRPDKKALSIVAFFSVIIFILIIQFGWPHIKPYLAKTSIFNYVTEDYLQYLKEIIWNVFSAVLISFSISIGINLTNTTRQWMSNFVAENGLAGLSSYYIPQIDFNWGLICLSFCSLVFALFCWYEAFYLTVFYEACLFLFWFINLYKLIRFTDLEKILTKFVKASNDIKLEFLETVTKNCIDKNFTLNKQAVSTYYKAFFKYIEESSEKEILYSGAENYEEGNLYQRAYKKIDKFLETFPPKRELLANAILYLIQIWENEAAEKKKKKKQAETGNENEKNKFNDFKSNIAYAALITRAMTFPDKDTMDIIYDSILNYHSDSDMIRATIIFALLEYKYVTSQIMPSDKLCSLGKYHIVLDKNSISLIEHLWLIWTLQDKNQLSTSILALEKFKRIGLGEKDTSKLLVNNSFYVFLHNLYIINSIGGNRS